MALTLRKNTGNDPLTFNQLDDNFEFFTGSYLTASHSPGALTFDPITTPTVVEGGMFYSSSGNFYVRGATYSPIIQANTSVNTATFTANSITATSASGTITAPYINVGTVLNGINYHELAHILFSPRVSTKFAKWVMEKQ